MDHDPSFVSPTGIKTIFPFLWAWKAARCLSKWGLLPTASHASRKLRELARWHAPEFVSRHELDPFKPDTFEVPFLLNRGFFATAYDLGPEQMLANNPVSDRGSDPLLWADFDRYIEVVMKKTLCFHGSSSARVMIKGHFLAAAEGLESRHSDVAFLTVTREPEKRLASMMNFVFASRLVTGTDTAVAPDKKSVLVVGEAVTRLEVDYIERERRFFAKNKGGRKVVIEFGEYVKNPSKAIDDVYKIANEGSVPEGVRDALARGKDGHELRSKMKYTINMSLAEFGVDIGKIKELK